MAMTPIMTTLAYVLSPDGRDVLLVHRTARSDDEQLGKWNGLGGKLEPDEDVVVCIARELAEEANIVPTQLRLRGTISWPGFGRDGADHFGFVFVVDAFTGEVPPANEEGTLAWQPVDRLDELEMWEGDRYFLPLVFDPEIAQFHAVLPYENGSPTDFRYTVLPG